MAPRSKNNTSVAYPLYREDGLAEGWYKFTDNYLRPEVLYGSFPSVTSIKLGGRVMEVDRPVAVKIKLLEEREDAYFWCEKKQHRERINLGEYHRDFGDVEVAYSFSAPQTHIWFAGYSIHCEAFENLSFTSYNATVRVRPEHLLGEDCLLVGREEFEAGLKGDTEFKPRDSHKGGVIQTGVHGRIFKAGGGAGGSLAAARAVLTSSPPLEGLTGQEDGTPFPSEVPIGGKEQRALLIQQYLEQQMGRRPGYSPLYSCQVPLIREGLPDREMVSYVYTGLHLNDCERDILQRDEYNVGCGIAKRSSPVSVPPLYPALEPYEVPELTFSGENAKAKGGLHISEVTFHRKTGEQYRKMMERRLPQLMNVEKRCCINDFTRKPLDPYILDETEELNAARHGKHQHLDAKNRRNKYLPTGVAADGSFVFPGQFRVDTTASGSEYRDRSTPPRVPSQTRKSHKHNQNNLAPPKHRGFLSERSPSQKSFERHRYNALLLDPFDPNRIPATIAPDQDVALRKLSRLTPSPSAANRVPSRGVSSQVERTPPTRATMADGSPLVAGRANA